MPPWLRLMDPVSFGTDPEPIEVPVPPGEPPRTPMASAYPPFPKK